MEIFLRGVDSDLVESRKKTFFEILSLWNKTHNLVQRDTLCELESRHWNDSCRLFSVLNKIDDLDTKKFLDIGSGAGFPGLVLAIHGFDVTLSEVVSKKIYFLEEVLLRCNLQSHCRVVCDVHSLRDDFFDVVVSRAFSHLSDILTVQESVSRETTLGFYHKGESHLSELLEAQSVFNFEHIIHQGSTPLSSGVILEVSNLSKKS